MMLTWRAPALACVVTVAAVVTHGLAYAQVPATNDVASCALLEDPTAQRTCLESARQKRPAASFDPSAAHVRNATSRAPVEDVTGLRGSLGASPAKSRASHRRKPANPAPASSDPPPQMP